MTFTKTNTAKLILILLIAFNLAFIFYQSILSKEESGEVSDNVSDVLEEIIPPDTKPGEFVHKNVRKIAHFVEFFSLGALSSAYIFFFMRSYKSAALTLPSAILVALIDETIQIFSDRGPSVKDVWIDASGFFVASLIFYTVATLLALIVKKVNNNRQIKE